MQFANAVVREQGKDRSSSSPDPRDKVQTRATSFHWCFWLRRRFSSCTTDTLPSVFHVSPGLDGQFEVHGHLDSAIELTHTREDGPTDTRTAGQNGPTRWYSFAGSSWITTPPDQPPTVNDPM